MENLQKQETFNSTLEFKEKNTFQKKNIPSVFDAFKILMQSIYHHWFSFNKHSLNDQQNIINKNVSEKDSMQAIVDKFSKIKLFLTDKYQIDHDLITKNHPMFEYSSSSLKVLTPEQEDILFHSFKDNFSIQTLEEMKDSRVFISPRFIQEVEKKENNINKLLQKKILPPYEYGHLYLENFLLNNFVCYYKDKNFSISKDKLLYYYDSYLPVAHLTDKMKSPKDQSLIFDWFKNITLKFYNFEKLNGAQYRNYFNHLLNITSFFEKDILTDEQFKNISEHWEAYHKNSLDRTEEANNSYLELYSLRSHLKNKQILDGITDNKETPSSTILVSRSVLDEIENKMNIVQKFELKVEEQFYIKKIDTELDLLFEDYEKITDKTKVKDIVKKCLTHIQEGLQNIIDQHENKIVNELVVQEDYLNGMKERMRH